MQQPWRGGGLRNQTTRSSQTRQPQCCKPGDLINQPVSLQDEEEFSFPFLLFYIALLFYLLYYGFVFVAGYQNGKNPRPSASLSRAGTIEGYCAGASFFFIFIS